MTYAMTLTNPEKLRLTLFVTPPVNEAPHVTAERIANADPMHRRYGPWLAARCERAA